MISGFLTFIILLFLKFIFYLLKDEEKRKDILTRLGYVEKEEKEGELIVERRKGERKPVDVIRFVTIYSRDGHMEKKELQAGDEYCIRDARIFKVIDGKHVEQTDIVGINFYEMKE